MARLWSGGAELNSSSMEHKATSGAAATIQGTTKRSGNYAYKILNPSSSTLAGWMVDVQSGPTHFYGRFYLYVATVPNVTNTIYVFTTQIDFAGLEAATSATRLIWFQLDTNGDLVCHTTTTNLGTITLGTGQWYRVEYKVDATQSAGSDIIEVRIDGVTQISNTGLTLTTGQDVFFFGGNLSDETATSGEWYFDDIAFNDNSGTAQTSWPGAGYILHLRPNSAGDFAEGTQGGASGSATAFQNVDEETPNDATDYWVLADPSSGSTDADRLDVDIESFSPTNVDITLVQVGVRVGNDGSANSSFVLRIKSQSSGTILEGSTITFVGAGGTFVTHDDSSLNFNYKLTSYTDPQAGGPWTSSLLGTTQIGIRAPDATPDVNVTTLWLLVEYTDTVTTSHRLLMLGVGI